MSTWNWRNVGLGIALFVLMMIFPPTRAIIVFILPLGRGIDDLLFLAALGAGIAIWGGRWYLAWKVKRDIAVVNRNPKLKLWVLLSLIVGVSLTLSPTGVPIQNYFLMGKPFPNDPAILIWGLAEIVSVLVIWMLLSKKGKR